MPAGILSVLTDERQARLWRTLKGADCNFYNCSSLSHRSSEAKEIGELLWRRLLKGIKNDSGYMFVEKVPPVICRLTPGYRGYKGWCGPDGYLCLAFSNTCPLSCMEFGGR